MQRIPEPLSVIIKGITNCKSGRSVFHSQEWTQILVSRQRASHTKCVLLKNINQTQNEQTNLVNLGLITACYNFHHNNTQPAVARTLIYIQVYRHSCCKCIRLLICYISCTPLIASTLPSPYSPESQFFLSAPQCPLNHLAIMQHQLKFICHKFYAN